MNLLLYVLGVSDESSRWYAFWSGFGSDLSYFSVFVVLYRKHNCHCRGCWRIGHLPVGDYIFCRKHAVPILKDGGQ